MCHFKTIIVIILFSIIYTQEYIDVIHLKNGDIIKGNIIENIINDDKKELGRFHTLKRKNNVDKNN